MISYLETREKTQCAALMARSHANNVELIPLRPGCWRASLGASKRWKGKPDLLSVISSDKIFRLHISKISTNSPFSDGSPEVQQQVHAAFVLSRFSCGTHASFKSFKVDATLIWNDSSILLGLHLFTFRWLFWQAIVTYRRVSAGDHLNHEDIWRSKWQKWIWVTDVTTETDIQRKRNKIFIKRQKCCNIGIIGMFSLLISK